jgi:hypothetical protein
LAPGHCVTCGEPTGRPSANHCNVKTKPGCKAETDNWHKRRRRAARGGNRVGTDVVRDRSLRTPNGGRRHHWGDGECHCGCGQPLPGGRGDKIYLDDTHRKRGQRIREEFQKRGIICPARPHRWQV